MVLPDHTITVLCHKYLETFLKRKAIKKTALGKNNNNNNNNLEEGIALNAYFWNNTETMQIYLPWILNSHFQSQCLQSGQVCNPWLPLQLIFSTGYFALAQHLCFHNCLKIQVKAACKGAGFKKQMGPHYPQIILRAVTIQILVLIKGQTNFATAVKNLDHLLLNICIYVRHSKALQWSSLESNSARPLFVNLTLKTQFILMKQLLHL